MLSDLIISSDDFRTHKDRVRRFPLTSYPWGGVYDNYIIVEVKMFSWRLASPLVLVLFLFALCVGRTRSDNLCPVYNVSYENFSDGCGTYDWELVASSAYDY